MALVVHDTGKSLLTWNQLTLLNQLDYQGTYDLTVAQAAEIIDGLLEIRAQEEEYYNNPLLWIRGEINESKR